MEKAKEKTERLKEGRGGRKKKEGRYMGKDNEKM